MTFRPYRRPTGYQFDGEPRLIMTPAGTTIEVKAGQPVMDAGVENAIQISIFTEPGWFGNLFLDPDHRVGDSTFSQICEGSLTKSTFTQAESEARRALKWMVDDGLASEVRVSVYNRQGIGIDAELTVVRPNESDETLTMKKNGLNWIRQGTDPASGRLHGDYGITT